MAVMPGLVGGAQCLYFLATGAKLVPGPWRISAPFWLGYRIPGATGSGRYQAIKSEDQDGELQPVNWPKVNDKVSLGFGVNYQSIDAEMTSATPLAGQYSRAQGRRFGLGLECRRTVYPFSGNAGGDFISLGNRVHAGWNTFGWREQQPGQG
jgi:hypothetical protein